MTDELEGYRSRRDLDASPEPPGEPREPSGRTLFVIQQHDASSMHFDVRLEADGVLKFWAVPKGPSTDPRNKQLAVRTEDHALDDADFEGDIPEEQYGGGEVIVGDIGRYRNLTVDDARQSGCTDDQTDGRAGSLPSETDRADRTSCVERMERRTPSLRDEGGRREGRGCSRIERKLAGRWPIG